ncbi:MULTISPECIES: cell wall hydrolase [Sphingopyxis]|nr:MULTISPECIES: cell wall hydrolase [Sphingopyxis]
MIPQLDIQRGSAARTRLDDADLTAFDASAPRRIGWWLAAMALAAALIVAAATNDRISRALSELAAGWTDDPEVTAAAERKEAIARLIAETETEIAEPALEGESAIARNAELPVSTLPIEAARPFFLPTLSAVQTGNAQRCLTQAIYYEAATESDTGKAAVAQVILNRMRHPAYPNTVCGVIYQGSSRPGCQFSFACDGSMRRAPVPALWRRAGEIARAALAGHVERSVGMATHYHANYVLPYWAPRLTKIDQIDTHIFYRWPGGWGRPAAFANGYSGSESIPAFEQLYQGFTRDAADEETEALAVAGAPPRDPTDRRADNDVGGRIDVTKGWTPNIPDPTQTKSRFDALTSKQGPASVAAAASE